MKPLSAFHVYEGSNVLSAVDLPKDFIAMKSTT